MNWSGPKVEEIDTTLEIDELDLETKVRYFVRSMFKKLKLLIYEHKCQLHYIQRHSNNASYSPLTSPRLIVALTSKFNRYKLKLHILLAFTPSYSKVQSETHIRIFY